MTPFTRIEGTAAAIPQPNIDTDVIIRIERLTAHGRDELGPFAFEALAQLADGSPNPDFVLHQPMFRDSPILIAGPNFGCGSSREGAVWALAGRGIRCVIAESFGDIFFSNCFQNGVLPVRLAREQVAQLGALTGQGRPLTVDLVEKRIEAHDGSSFAIEIDPMKRQALLEGLDDISATMRRTDAIDTWQRQDRIARPWVWAR
ncbi:3-isopropylmalate dehydratase small subunit [Variovorax sp. KK3]|uniref:3-isopropylmalate dehydratase small subunit n=1 Tax=Variovorax sp. KK3 TaxID=1855728 RepID=UPI00097C3260|nr:3-isopropylmalate dehydratase small subunit [Variovorax sp. KK3]